MRLYFENTQHRKEWERKRELEGERERELEREKNPAI
jgi:hypothetical protein